MEQPPIIQAEPVTARNGRLGQIGLCFSLAALSAIAAMMLFRPG